MAYFAVGMALHAEGSCEDVLGSMTDGLGWASGAGPVALPSKSAIFRARERLGAEPMRALFARVARPLAAGGVAGGAAAGRDRPGRVSTLPTRRRMTGGSAAPG
jgi:hypothetical protein